MIDAWKKNLYLVVDYRAGIKDEGILALYPPKLVIPFDGNFE
jgi:hypothetical protein